MNDTMFALLTHKEIAGVTKPECNLYANYDFVTARCQFFLDFTIFRYFIGIRSLFRLYTIVAHLQHRPQPVAYLQHYTTISTFRSTTISFHF